MKFKEISDYLQFRRDKHLLYQRTFSTSEGEQVLKDICRKAFLHKSSYCPGDPAKTNFNEGMRTLALEILRYTHQDPDRLAEQLIKEES